MTGCRNGGTARVLRKAAITQRHFLCRQLLCPFRALRMRLSLLCAFRALRMPTAAIAFISLLCAFRALRGFRIGS